MELMGMFFQDGTDGNVFFKMELMGMFF